MSRNASPLSDVAEFGERYQAEYLDQPPDDPGVNEDPFRLRFFLKRAMASARSETVSVKYRHATEDVLLKYESQLRRRLNDADRGITDDKLNAVLEDEGVGNRHDRRMVMDLLEYISGLGNQDIINHTKQVIREGEVNVLFDQLTELHNIGPKKATLFLRDVTCYWQLEDYVDGEQYCFLLPIDTWVHQIGQMIGVVSTDTPNWETNSRDIVEACGTDVSPLHFNQGAWYLGANSLDILIENLSVVEP